MAQKLYTLIEHTADICIQVKGRDLREVFRKSAQAVFSIIAHQERVKNREKMTFDLKIKADNRAELLVNWLNELLSLSDAHKLIFTEFRLVKMEEDEMEATVTGTSMDNYRMKTEVKAATYHDLKLDRAAHGYLAQVIFDV